jgi:hypothetical protein
MNNLQLLGICKSRVGLLAIGAVSLVRLFF